MELWKERTRWWWNWGGGAKGDKNFGRAALDDFFKIRNSKKHRRVLPLIKKYWSKIKDFLYKNKYFYAMKVTFENFKHF